MEISTKIIGSELEPGEEYLYLLMYAPGSHMKFGEAVQGSTWLQKQMFLLDTKLPEIEMGFDKKYYGPYSPKLDGFRIKGMELGTIIQSARRGRLCLSKDGIEIGMELWNNAKESVRSVTSSIKRFTNDMTYHEIIAYFYSKFPEMAAKSEILKEFGETRVDSACSLFEREKVSMGRAAIIAGMSKTEFSDELETRGIPEYVVTLSAMQEATKRIEGAT